MKNLLLYAVILFSFTSLEGCKNKAEAPDPPGFCLSDTLKKKITIEEVNLQPVKNAVALSGKIDANEDKVVKVFPVVGGIVEELRVQLGDYVKKGEVLATIRSGEIAEFQNQLSAAESNQRLTEKALNDARDMYNSGLATQKEVMAAQADVDKARSELRRISQTASIYGVKDNATQEITAPVAGYIIEKNVTNNMHFRVDGSQSFFTIANLDEVWVIANVFEGDIAKIKEGDEAEVKVIAYSDRVFTGKVDRIFSILDPQSRVMKIRIRIPNTEKLLKPEMFAQINIKYSGGGEQMLAIPSRAIIFDKNKNFVMVYKGDCDIDTREIEVHQTIGDTSYIKSGLQAGEKIISKFQLLVYDALND